MDSFAALALATEPPSRELLDRPPHPKNTYLISAFMWKSIFGHAIYQTAVLILLIFLAQRNDWLVYNYSHYCLQYAGPSKTHCLLYNPYHSQELYWTKEEVERWKQIQSKGLFASKGNFVEAPQEDQETQKLLHHTLIF